MSPRIAMPVIVVAAGVVSFALGYQTPLALPVLLQVPITWALLFVGILLTWQANFLVASIVCAAVTALFLLPYGIKNPNVLVIGIISWPVPLAGIQLLFFRSAAKSKLWRLFQQKRERQ